VPGRIVDFCSDVPPAQGFLLDKGVYTTIEAPGASTTIPFGINNRGQIVGVSFDGVRYRGFLLSNGTFTTPATPPGTFATSFPVDIDDRGRIVGDYQ
jgi:probable HAF family extracellular repeat protein